MAELEARLFVAPGDAVGPAVLLTVGGSRGAQVPACAFHVLFWHHGFCGDFDQYT